MSNPIEVLVTSMSVKEFRFIEKKTGVSFAKMNAEDGGLDFLVGIAAVKKNREEGIAIDLAWDFVENMPLVDLTAYLGLDDLEEEVEDDTDAQAIVAAFEG